MRKSAYLYYITVDIDWRSLSGGMNRELALVECSEKGFWVTRDERRRAHAPISSNLYPVCIKETNKSLLREDSSFSFMPYYPSDLKSLSHTNAVKTCAMSVQTPPVQCAPYLTPLLSGPTFNVALLSRAAWLSVFALCFANTAVVSRRKNSLR